ncbi:MAG: HAMP domain-containing sensor histidine kinase [Clostridiales bacterium]
MKILNNERVIINIFLSLIIFICLSISFIVTINCSFEIRIIVYFLLFMICVTSFLFVKIIFFIINSTLEVLSDYIQSLIEGNYISKNVNKKFELDKDTLLGKINNQILKLQDIVNHERELLTDDKNRINSLISDISHQLKVPTANIILYNTFLIDKKLNNLERENIINNLNSQLKKLEFLIDSLVKLSRLEIGYIKLKQERLPILQTVLQAIGEINNKATGKNIIIKLKNDTDIDVYHDKVWTEEAIFNFLDNAVKYSKENSEIVIEIIKYNLFCRIDIKDFGCGITEDDYTNIFKRFYRGKNSNDVEGAGLGLYLTRKIISEQGGYIKVKSIYKKETLFSVFLLINKI